EGAVVHPQIANVEGGGLRARRFHREWLAVVGLFEPIQMPRRGWPREVTAKRRQTPFLEKGCLTRLRDSRRDGPRPRQLSIKPRRSSSSAVCSAVRSIRRSTLDGFVVRLVPAQRSSFRLSEYTSVSTDTIVSARGELLAPTPIVHGDAKPTPK